MAGAPRDAARFGLTPETLGDVRVLGRGANGWALALPDGERVLKITADADEAALAQSFLDQTVRGLPRVEYVAEVLGLPRGLFGAVTDGFLIVMERAVPAAALRGTERADLLAANAVIGGARGVEIQNARQRDWYDDLVAAGEALMTAAFGGGIESEEDIVMFLSEEADTHFENLGLIRRGGRWQAVILDFGQAQVPEEMLEFDMAVNRRG